MRVLHLVESSTFNPILTDIARHSDRSRITLFAGSLAERGDMHQRLSALDVKTFSLDCSGKAHYPGAILRLALYLRRQKVDVLHTHLVAPSLIGLSAARLAATPVRVLTRHHSDAVLLSGSRTALAIDRLNGRYLADETIAVSEATRRATIEIDGVPESKVTVVPNGFDWNRVQADPQARDTIRSEFGLGNDPVLCTVGRLDPLKGHDVLLRAFLKAELPGEARLLIVGDGPQRKSLQASAQHLGVAGRCIFTGYRADAYDIMAASDLMVHPSFSEAHSLTIIEALSLGCSVVATKVGAAEEVVIPGETGWLVSPRDHSALGQSLHEALIDPGRAHAYAQAGRELVRSKYPIGRMIEGYEAVYARHLRID